MEDRMKAAQAKAKATAAAKAGMADPDSDMVAIKAIAGFELAEIFAEWARREDAEGGKFKGPQLERCDGLGPPWRVFGGADWASDAPDDHRLTTTWGETPEAYGERIARGILKLLKEV